MKIHSALAAAKTGKRVIWAAATVRGRNEAWRDIKAEVAQSFPEATVIEHRARVEFEPKGYVICRVLGSDADTINLAGLELDEANEHAMKFDRVRAQVGRG